MSKLPKTLQPIYWGIEALFYACSGIRKIDGQALMGMQDADDLDTLIYLQIDHQMRAAALVGKDAAGTGRDAGAA